VERKGDSDDGEQRTYGKVLQDDFERQSHLLASGFLAKTGRDEEEG